MPTREITLAEDLALRPPALKVFVSSEMRGGALGEERLAAAEAIEGGDLGIGRFRAWYWERDAIAGPYSSETVCVEEARASDALVLLVAGTVTGITRKEYEAARDNGRPCFVFLKAGVERDEAAQAFVRAERDRGTVTVTFADTAELRHRIVEALSALAARSVRLRGWQARFRPQVVLSSAGAGAVPSDPAWADRYAAVTVPRPQGQAGRVAVGQVVEDMRRLAEGGHHRGVVDLALDALGHLEGVALPHATLGVLAELHRTVPREAVDRRDLVRILHAEGLALGGLGRDDEAIAALEQMRDLGREQCDREAVALAEHSLGARFHLRGDLDGAARLYRSALGARLDLDELYGAFQLWLDLASLAQDRGDLDGAAEILAEAGALLKSAPDPHLLLTLHGNLGLVAVKRGRLVEAEAHFRRSLDYARRSGDRGAEVTALHNLGAVNSERGELGEAIRWYRRALRAADEVGAPPQQRMLHASFAVALHCSGRHREAADHFWRAADLALAFGDRHAWAAATADRAALLLTLDEAATAMPLLDQALAAFRELRDEAWEGRVLRNLTEAHFGAGDAEATERAAEEALRRMGTEEVEERAHVLVRAAEARLERRDDPDRAAGFLERAFAEQRRSGDQAAAARLAYRAGVVLAEHGRHRDALTFFGNALVIFRRLDDLRGAFDARNSRAIALTNLGRDGEAREDLTACHVLAGQIGDRHLEVLALGNLGETERRAGRAEVALDPLRRAIALARELDDGPAEATALGTLGIALGDADHWPEAEEAFREARRLARRTRDKSAEAVAIGGLARCAFVRGAHAGAARLYRRAADLELAIGDTGHALEDLAGLAEALSEAGDKDGATAAAQRLVDTAQESGGTAFAGQALTRIARCWLARGAADEATDLYAAAIVLGLLGDEEAFWDDMAAVFVMMVLQVEDRPEIDQDEFYGRVLAAVAERHAELTQWLPHLRTALDAARRAVSDSAAQVEPASGPLLDMRAGA